MPTMIALTRDLYIMTLTYDFLMEMKYAKILFRES